MLLARQSIAKRLNVKENEIFFTSGATEANNWAILSQAYLARQLYQKNHIVTSAIEHPSVHEITKRLAEDGFEITYLLPDDEGAYQLEDFEAATKETTMGWIAMAVNNEVGSILPVFELGERAKELQVWFHVDTVQAIGHLGWDFGNLACTSFVASGHKFNAPKGIGFLVYRPFDPAMILQALLIGGGQENSKRSGTENIPYILGMAKALELAYLEQADNLANFSELESYLFSSLTAAGFAYEVNGDREHKVPYINNIWLKGKKASQNLIRLDLSKAAVSAGSACSAGSLQVSRILKTYHPNDRKRWEESLRISFGYHTMKADIDEFISILKKL